MTGRDNDQNGVNRGIVRFAYDAQNPRLLSSLF